tara:strand:- start:1633 stop:2319 length:687 start_codon:yes stop_codon:yes gene_type:complete
LGTKNSIKHLSIILDGNKRWAKKNNKPILEAYNSGIDNVINISEVAIDNNIEYLSVFALSTENLHRKSINILFNSIGDKFSYFLNKIVQDKKIKIKIIGERNNLPSKFINLINIAEKETKNNKQLSLILAFNYGFKNELLSVLNKVLIDNKLKKITQKEMDKLFSLSKIPDPDILVRTGGFKRLSNYIMYNLCYTELFFTDILWPDFNKNNLNEIINQFYLIKRNYGL